MIIPVWQCPIIQNVIFWTRRRSRRRAPGNAFETLLLAPFTRLRSAETAMDGPAVSRNAMLLRAG